MKILLTGATGYIGKRLLPILVAKGYEVICCVRDKNRFYCPEEFLKKVSVIEVDFLKRETLTAIPTDIDAAYYLIHSMSGSDDNYDELERVSAENFVYGIKQTIAKQVIYLSGIVNDKSLSKHLSSRKKVEDILNNGNFAMTTLRAGIIVGSGSASFEIIRDLVNKLPVMITPKWLNTKCQPIAIPDVLDFLSKSLLYPVTYGKSFDIGGPDILTYKEMLLGFAKAKNLKRWIYTAPIMTPKLSSYWLYFVTSTSYKLASALVSSMKVEVVCRDNKINDLLEVKPMSYEQALSRALIKVDEDKVASSWKIPWLADGLEAIFLHFEKSPRKTALSTDEKNQLKTGISPSIEFGRLVEKPVGIMAIGCGIYVVSSTKYSAAWVPEEAEPTNTRFIRVTHWIFGEFCMPTKREGKLVLYAEMKLPGEAWLEFKIINNTLYQSATFRPKGSWGKLYWYAVWPFHGFIFQGMLNKLIK